MRIRLAILESDVSYLNRMVSVFGTKYADKFEIYSFTNGAYALEALEESKIDVLIASDVFVIDVENLPKRCGFAYLVDTPEVAMVREQRAICKFQKADLIYKQILSIYSENAGSVSGLKLDDDSTKIVTFVSASGGVGSSVMAAACAMRYASQGKKTLYLNLEKFGSADVFFAGEGQFDMSDIIFALKSKKANLSMKLESCVKQDARGVYFFSQSKLALDMLELNAEEIIELISVIKAASNYDYLVLDLDFAMDKDMLKIYRQSHALIWVGDGSKVSNIKTYRAYKALEMKEQNVDSPLTNRMCLIYNKFSNKTSNTLEATSMRNIGGAPRYEHATIEQIMEQLAGMEMFDKIL